jgi:hypothetical protein
VNPLADDVVTFTISTLLPQIVSAALMLTGPRGQGLTDLVLGSVAINRARFLALMPYTDNH